jgi:hypothetical protein
MSDLQIEAGIDNVIIFKCSKRSVEIKLKPGEVKIIPMGDYALMVRRIKMEKGKNSKIKFALFNLKEGTFNIGEI